MAETPEQMHARVKDALRVPPVEEWDTWPFAGSVVPKALDPLTPEPEIHGAGGVGCRACTAGDDAYLWAGERWRVTSLPEPSGLPVIVILEPREHVPSPAELTSELAAEQGVMVSRCQRAVLSVGGVAKVHIGVWGEGAEHLHWWFIARPEGFGQLRSSFNEIWDEVLPPVPLQVWHDNLAQVARSLHEQAAG